MEGQGPGQRYRQWRGMGMMIQGKWKWEWTANFTPGLSGQVSGEAGAKGLLKL